MSFKVGAVIVCAGEGRRLGRCSKATILLDNQPLFLRSLKVFESIKSIKQIVLVLKKKDFPLAKKKIRSSKVVLTKGGKGRRDSVLNGLSALNKDINYVLIHDGARPFVSQKLVKNILKELKNTPAVICGVGSSDTLKLASNGYVKKTLNRDIIFLIQTPQGFNKGLLLKAYKRFRNKAVTDDAQMIEFLGKRVKIIPGEVSNFKITYPQDVKLARAINYEKL